MREKTIEEALGLLINQARRENKLICSYYQDLVFTPDELEQANKQGQFLWGRSEWYLETKEHRRALLEKDVTNALAKLSEFDMRIK